MKAFTVFKSVLAGSGFNINQIRYKKRRIKVIQIILILGIISLVLACENVYNSSPQPVDSKNIYSFPREFRGMWTCERDTLIIAKDYSKYTQFVGFSVPKQDVDSSSSFVIKDDKIFIINKHEMELRGGFPFKLENDTIYYQERNVVEVALGKKAFLRKVNKNYILNIKQESGWWEAILIKKDKEGNIITAGLDIQELQKYKNYKSIHTFKQDEYSRTDYIEATWTKKELLGMINKGVFSNTLFKLHPNKSFCNDTIIDFSFETDF